jgi:flagellar motor switch protein FliG
VLVSALDEDAAEAILQQMSADDAAKVRSALVELDDIAADEQQQVLSDFLRQQAAPALAPIADDDVSLDLDPAVEAAAGENISHSEQVVPPPSRTVHDEPSFAFLQHVEPKAIAFVLRHEHPQTAAVVVAQLSPHQAAAVLQELPPALATEALERIAWLDELSPEVIADLAGELRRQLAPHINAHSAGSASLAHLTAVLGAMDFRQRQRAVLQLGQRNTPLLNRLGLFPEAAAPAADNSGVIALRYRLDSEVVETKPSSLPAVAAATTNSDESWLTFDDLMLLDDAMLRSVFAAADTDVALLALTGAEPRFISRILRKLPARAAAVLRRRLEHPGPTRLRDIEQARAALAAVATRLAHEGAIVLPDSVRFAAAV